MSEILPYSGAKIYDVFNVDELIKMGTLLDDDIGVKLGSNARIFDGLLQTQNNQLVTLQSQLSQLIQTDYVIYYIELAKDTTITSSSSYIGSNTSFSELKEDYLYIFKFDSNNIGNVQININGLGYNSVYKISNNTSSQLQDDDIKSGVPYLFLYKNNQFIYIGENNVQQIKTMTNGISSLEQRVDALYGAVIYLGTIDIATADITQDALTNRAIEILTGRGQSTDLKQGYTLVDSDINDWWYDEADLLWINIGYSGIATATNTSKGVVIGSISDGKVSIDSTDGTMITNGTMLKSTYDPTGAVAAAGGISGYALPMPASAITYYVSGTGSDATGDGSQANPWRSLQFAINHLPKFSMYPRTINCVGTSFDDVTYTNRSTLVNISNFIGAPITIQGAAVGDQAKTALFRLSGFVITHCSSYIQIVGFMFCNQSITDGIGLDVTNSPVVTTWCRTQQTTPNGGNTQGVVARYNAYIECNNIVINNRGYGFSCATGGRIVLNICSTTSLTANDIWIDGGIVQQRQALGSTGGTGIRCGNGGLLVKPSGSQLGT